MSEPTIDKKRICIGYGKYEGKCRNIAGTSHTPYWCERCDILRRKTITNQLSNILKSFDKE